MSSKLKSVGPLEAQKTGPQRDEDDGKKDSESIESQ